MKIKEEYKEIIKDTLKCYNLLTAHIDELQSQLKEILLFDGVAGINYSGDGIKTNNINKLVENTALRNIEDAILIKENLERANFKLSRLDCAIGSLDLIEKEIIIYRYLEGFQWSEIVSELNYSERTCRDKLNEAIIKMAFIFYGDIVLLRD